MARAAGHPRRQGTRAACSVSFVHFSHTTASVRQPKRTVGRSPSLQEREHSGSGVHDGIPAQVPGLLPSNPVCSPGRIMRGISVFPSSNRVTELADIGDSAHLHFSKMAGRAFFGDQTERCELQVFLLTT